MILGKHSKFFVVALHLVLIFFAVSACGEQKSTFIVRKGEEFKITEKHLGIIVDRWEMEDDSTIWISPDVKTWVISASEASFGKNTKIIGSGSDGINKENPGKKGSDGSECNDGGHGSSGNDGTDGTNGVDVNITMGLVRATDLTIDVHGGDGGIGSRGGRGGKGGRASCGGFCEGQEGGNGGNGGDGGDGGDGGSVSIKYWIVGRSLASTEVVNTSSDKIEGLQIIAKGGKGGKGGDPGRYGDGGDGRDCGIYTRSGGPGGREGSRGRDGLDGNLGKVKFSVISKP